MRSFSYPKHSRTFGNTNPEKNPRGLIRTSVRKDGENTHETISTLTELTLEQLVLIQASLQGNVVLKKDFVIKNSKEYEKSEIVTYSYNRDKAIKKILISKTEDALSKIAALKRPVDDSSKGVRVGKIINKYNVSKLLTVETNVGTVT